MCAWVTSCGGLISGNGLLLLLLCVCSNFPQEAGLQGNLETPDGNKLVDRPEKEPEMYVVTGLDNLKSRLMVSEPADSLQRCIFSDY